MTDLSPTFLSSATSFVASQTAKIGNAATDTKNSFATALTRVQTTVGLKPKAGFTAGPTYQATTLTGQTQAVAHQGGHHADQRGEVRAQYQIATRLFADRPHATRPHGEERVFARLEPWLHAPWPILRDARKTPLLRMRVFRISDSHFEASPHASSRSLAPESPSSLACIARTTSGAC